MSSCPLQLESLLFDSSPSVCAASTCQDPVYVNGCMYVHVWVFMYVCVCFIICGHSIPCSIGRCVYVECGEACSWSWSGEAVSCVSHSRAHHQACHIGDCHSVPCQLPLFRWHFSSSLYHRHRTKIAVGDSHEEGEKTRPGWMGQGWRTGRVHTHDKQRDEDHPQAGEEEQAASRPVVRQCCQDLANKVWHVEGGHDEDGEPLS